MTDYTERIKELREYSAARKGEIAEITKGAADVIEEQQKKIIEWQEDACKWNNEYYALLDSQPHWIPVTERLPEQDGEYLVCGRWRGEPIKIWVCERVTLGPIMGWENPAENPVISHWMPLPEPPKEETCTTN